jgi:hypothetical protein
MGSNPAQDPAAKTTKDWTSVANGASVSLPYMLRCACPILDFLLRGSLRSFSWVSYSSCVDPWQCAHQLSAASKSVRPA